MRPEDRLQSAIVRYLGLALPTDCVSFSVPNGAVLAGDKMARIRQVAKLKSTGMTPGAPDLIVVARGVTIGLEVKMKQANMQPNQRAFGDKLTAAGGRYHVVRSVEEVEQVLLGEGIPLRATNLPLACGEARPIGDILPDVIDGIAQRMAGECQ